MTEQLTVFVRADGPATAVYEAKRWARGEAGLRLRTICRVVQPDPSLDVWHVTVAVSWRDRRPTAGVVA